MSRPPPDPAVFGPPGPSSFLPECAAALAPNLATALLAHVNRWLPDGRPDRLPVFRAPAVRGANVPLAPPVRAAIVLGERAADRNNER